MENDEDAITWNNRGTSLHSQKLFHEALEAYNRAIALDPSEPIFQANKEKVLFDMQKPKLDLSSQISEEPLKLSEQDDAISWNNKGYSLSGNGLHTEALLAYERAIELDPNNPIFWKNKAKTLEDLKQSGILKTEQKSANYREAISWNNQGYSLAEAGDYKGALSAYNQAIHFSPDFSEAWNNKGYALMELGNIEEAIDCFHMATKINPDFAKPWIRKFILLTYLVRNDDALETIFKMSK
jgi:tetratricopeptide (TPR) repeat protein